MSIKASPIEELYDRIEKTAKIRFRADRRLLDHAQMTIWTTTLTSVALITISVWDALQITKIQPHELVDAIQILSSVFILAYSLILSTKEYGLKAEAMHRCGLELSALRSRLYPHLSQANNPEEYQTFQDKYDLILSHYTNHEAIDYQRMLITSKPYKKAMDLKEKVWAYFLFVFLYLIEFAHYYVVITLEFFLAWKVII